MERVSGSDPRRSSQTGWGRGGAAALPLPLSCGKGGEKRVLETALPAPSLLVPGEVLRGGLCESGSSELVGVQHNWCRGGAEQSFSKPKKPLLGEAETMGRHVGRRADPFGVSDFRLEHGGVDGTGCRVERAGGREVREGGVGGRSRLSTPKRPLSACILFPEQAQDPICPSDKLVNKAQERRKSRLGMVRPGWIFWGGGSVALSQRRASSLRAVSTAYRRRKISPGPCQDGLGLLGRLPGRRTPSPHPSELCVKPGKPCWPKTSAKVRRDHQQSPSGDWGGFLKVPLAEPRGQLGSRKVLQRPRGLSKNHSFRKWEACAAWAMRRM